MWYVTVSAVQRHSRRRVHFGRLIGLIAREAAGATEMEQKAKPDMVIMASLPLMWDEEGE